MSSLGKMFITLNNKRNSYILPDDQLIEVLSCDYPYKSRMFVGGYIAGNIIILWNALLEVSYLDMSLLTPSGLGNKPDFNDFSISDYGHSLVFGKDYEAAADWVDDNTVKLQLVTLRIR